LAEGIEAAPLLSMPAQKFSIAEFESVLSFTKTTADTQREEVWRNDKIREINDKLKQLNNDKTIKNKDAARLQLKREIDNIK
jgi:hypothetical protein